MARRAVEIYRSWRRQSRACYQETSLQRIFGTDLDIILRECGVDTVIISRTTYREFAASHGAGRDVSNYRVVFLSTRTRYLWTIPDRGLARLPAAEVHHATLVILPASTGPCDVSGRHEDANIEPREDPAAAAIR